jgi:hypothetical protein
MDGDNRSGFYLGKAIGAGTDPARVCAGVLAGVSVLRTEALKELGSLLTGDGIGSQKGNDLVATASRIGQPTAPDTLAAMPARLVTRDLILSNVQMGLCSINTFKDLGPNDGVTGHIGEPPPLRGLDGTGPADSLLVWVRIGHRDRHTTGE